MLHCYKITRLLCFVKCIGTCDMVVTEGVEVASGVPDHLSLVNPTSNLSTLTTIHLYTAH